MKISNTLFVILFICLLGCDDESELPVPEFKANITSTAGSWEANSGTLIFFEKDGIGVVQLKLGYSKNRIIQKQIHLGIADKNFPTDTPRIFSLLELSNDFSFFAEYFLNDNGQSDQNTWKASALHKNSLNLKINEVYNENGSTYASGEFGFVACQSNSIPGCITFKGIFTNIKCEIQ